MPLRAPSLHVPRLAFPALVAAWVAVAPPPPAARAADLPAPQPVRVFEEALVTLPTREDALRILAEIPDIEFLKPAGEEGVYRFVSTPEIDRRLAEMGYPVTVIVPDLEAQYAASASAGPGFGDFHTYSETEAYLDSIAAAFPAITTEKDSIGASLEGRALWAIKVSDNPDVDEDEGEILFDGVTHAREIMTVEMCLHYLNYLCSNYGVDPLATFLVDNREIWFVPIVNPDGFVYNETTNPNGGGLWRKNRRLNAGGCYGVDNNRNYSVGWGGINGSPDPCNEQYRGTAPNSEPENQVMEAFIDSRQFTVHQSFHSAAALVLLPWGYDHTVQTPDDSLLRAIGDEMARDSGYLVGQPGEVLYNAAGNAFDWSYGETTNHDKIFAYTTEISGSGFWPQTSEVPGLLAENLHAHIYMTQIAGAYLTLAGSAVSGENGNGRLDPGETADLSVSVKNLGVLSGITGVTATLATSDAYVALLEAEKSLGDFAAGETKSLVLDPFAVAVDASCPEGHEATFTVTLRSAGGYVSTETLTLTVGATPILYAQDFEAATDWTQDPSHTATTGAFVRIDPVATGFQPGDDASPPPGVFALITAQNPTGADGTDDVDGGTAATRSPVLDLSGYPAAHLSMMYFHGQRDAGGDASDLYRISLSNDGGATYPANLVAFGDASHAAVWTSLEADLESLLPLTNAMRILVQASDGTASGDIIEGGIDEVRITGSTSTNLAPGIPVAVSPTGGVTVGSSPSLVVTNATDPESDPLTYGFRVYADSLFTVVVASADGVAEGGGTTAWTVSPPLALGAYWWRAYAEDAETRGLLSDAAEFNAGTETGVASDGAAAPGAVALQPVAPNPTTGLARVSFDLPRAGRVFVAVVNVEGRVVRILEDGWRDAGRHDAIWDGRDGAGRAVASGAYLLRLEAGGVRRTERVNLVR
jgi:hypothetical protein